MMVSGTDMKHTAGWHSLVHGAITGITIHHIVLMILSYAWDFGYYVPCIGTLTEPFGGELNAALFELILSGTIGAIIAGLINHHRNRKGSVPNRGK